MAAFSHVLDVGAGTSSMTLTVGGASTVYSYDNATQQITFGSRAAPMTLTSMAELTLYVEAFRTWLGLFFKAFRPADTTPLLFVRTMVSAPTTIELDDSTNGLVTIDATFTKATKVTTLGARAAATMYWTDLRKWFVYLEAYAATCAEVP